MPQKINNNIVNKVYDLHFGRVSFYSNFLITELNEGICFGLEDAIEISELVSFHFKDSSFAYISNRINSYSLIPMNYLKLKEVFPNIKAFAAVTYSEIQKSVIEVENSFLDGMLENFNDLETAIEWVEQKLQD